MNIPEYNLFQKIKDALQEAYAKSIIRQLHVDEKNLQIYGDSKHFVWSLTVKKKK